MYWFERYLKQDQEFASATTGLQTIELPEKGLLSGIELRVWGTCGATAKKPDVWLHDRLTKIELISGGKEPLKSLSGEQLLAHMLYQKIPIFSHDIKNIKSGSAEEFFYLNMGRKYHDTEFVLDLSRLTDPKLQITYDFTKTSIEGWTNGVAMATSPVPKFSLICHMVEEFEEVPKGFIKTMEADRFTSAASKKENLDIPRGPVYSNLYLQSWYASEGLTTNLDELEISFGAGKRIPYRVSLTELLAQVVRKYGLFTLSLQAYLTGSQAFPWPFEVGHYFSRGAVERDCELYGGDLWGAANVTSVKKPSDGTALTTEHDFMVTLIGSIPFGIAAIPFVDPDDERTWIRSGEWGNLWVRIEEAAGAGTNAVIKLLTDEVVTEY